MNWIQNIISVFTGGAQKQADQQAAILSAQAENDFKQTKIIAISFLVILAIVVILAKVL